MPGSGHSFDMSEGNPPLTLAPGAVGHLRSLLREKNLPSGQGLRIGVQKGGCSGLEYVMEFGPMLSGDIPVGTEDAPAFLAADSMEHLKGCVIDYHDSLTSTGFKIFNPNAVRSCGCGTSFEPGRNAGTQS